MASNLVALILAQALALPAPIAASPAQRKPIQRTISITDDNLSTVPEIHVGADWPTTLVFATPLAKDNQAGMLAPARAEIWPPKVTDASDLLISRQGPA